MTSEEYLNFLMEVLQATAESEGDQDAVFPLLRNNQDKLDLVLQEMLQIWGTVTLAKLESEEANDIAAVIGNFSNLIQQFPLGNRSRNLEIAITGYEVALLVYTREDFPVQWATVQNNLGLAYGDRIKEDKAENLEQAIACFQQALLVRTQSDFPLDWAATQNNLGTAYSDRIKEDKAENLEQAIACFQQALLVRTQSDFPLDWATTQNNLGNAYSERIKEDKAENLEQAIAYFQQALLVRTQSDFPVQWAMTQNNLGAAYSHRIKEDKAENLEQAIACYQQALLVYTQSDFPVQWAATQNNLGNAYSERIKEDKAENLEKAIACFQQALLVRTQSDFPVQWAATQNSLAVAYSERIKEDKAENLEQAIAFYQQALLVYTQSDFPLDWAMTQNNLGIAYRNRIKEDKAENLEQAIACFQQALLVRTQSDFPLDWAMTQNNLGTAYSDRIKEDKAENLEQAIACFQQALLVYTQSDFPLDWAMTQNNLGIAYRNRIKEDKAENLEKAIACYQQALLIRTPEALPLDCLQTRSNLGNLHFSQKNWQQAIKSYQIAIEIVEDTRTLALDERRKQDIIAENIQVFNRIVRSYLQLKQPCPAIEYVERSKTRNLVELIATRELNQKIQPITFQEIQQLIDSNTAIIQWYLTKEEIFTFIVTQHRPQPLVKSFATSPELTNQIYNYLNLYLEDKQEWQTQLPSLLSNLAQTLHLDEIISPLEKEYSKILLIPHRALHLIPLHALPLFSPLPPLVPPSGGETEGGSSPLPKQENQQLFSPLPKQENQQLFSPLPKDENQQFFSPLRSGGRGGSSLLDYFEEVKYIPSCQLLKLIRNRTRPKPTNFFSIQNPTEDLFYTDMEVENISQIFQPNNNILAKQAATKTALYQQNLEDKHYHHFSCHGYFNFIEPLKSALALAGSSVPAEENNTSANSEKITPSPDKTIRSPEGETFNLDKCLTLADIFQLNLDECHLVTLSACETAISDMSSNSDEYISLPSGFIYAGACNVVATQWAVNDLSTAILMTRFYQLHKLNKLPVAKAMNQAQKWLRDSTQEDFCSWTEQLNNDLQLKPNMIKSIQRYFNRFNPKEQPFAEPYYWAAFCPIGE